MPTGVYTRTEKMNNDISNRWAKRFENIREYKYCLRCNKKFYITPSHPNRKYCCGLCWRQRCGDYVEITCQVCGKKLVRSNCNRKQKFCSLNCSNKYNSKLQDKSYIRGKTLEEAYGVERATEIKKILRENRLGIKFSNEHRKNIGIAASKRICKDSTSEKLRISLVEYIKNKCGGIGPIQGKYEKLILDKIQDLIGFSIKRQFYINGYFLDGYCQELNLAIEVDEEYHYINNILRQKDIDKQYNIIKALNCKFIRIREKDVVHNDKIVLGVVL